MYSKDEAYKQIAELTERFTEQLASYKKSDYNETLTRRDFIDPFFKALGWDVDNSQGYAEAYREVIHEERLKVGTASKAPDYSFRLPGGKRLFFVEAKKPSVFVKDEVLPAYQVRRYGWSAKLSVSLITDFEELAVYDCTKRPNVGDKASIGRIKYLTYTNYLQEFDFIWNTFSKGSVLKGSFDKFIASDSNKKGTATVDKAFLASLDEWRMLLAVNIAQRNHHLREDELNFVVQQTIDRIIFLRIAEDRKVEEYGELQNITKGVKAEGTFYSSLYNLFKEADSKYNSGLFDFNKDKLSSNINIDNKVLKNIIGELYYPICPYEFSVLGVEILGSAYEQFLGKQIKLDARHRAVIEEKPEVRKAGGVYYTPQYIVDYIVENTVGNLTTGKTPDDVAKLTIVDPACGSGSFLLGAYDFLLKWHLEYYKPEFIRLSDIAKSPDHNSTQRNNAIKERNRLPLTPEGSLTTAIKKQILLNNIYGVDIDTQAVEVTKLSLLLKCMEGETGSSINAQMRFGERVLPTLDNNIKSGNSLIDLDFYDTEYTTAEEKKIKPFSWQQAFPNIFNAKSKGFDVAIGNPPYGAVLTLGEDNYLRRTYSTANYQLDTYVLFIEKANQLCKEIGGYFGMIIPSAWVGSTYDVKFRNFMATKTAVQNIVITPKQTFKDATVETLIIIVEKNYPKNEIEVQRWDMKSKPSYKIKVDNILSNSTFNWPIYSNEIETSVIEKVREQQGTLSEYAEVVWGVKVYEKGKGTPPQKGNETENKIFHSSTKTKTSHRPLIGGGEINRYLLNWSGGYVDYGKWLAAPRQPHWFEGKRIVVREVTSKGIIQATIIENDYVFSNSVDGIKLLSPALTSLELILGILNSSLISFYHSKTSANAFKGTFPKVLLQDLRNLPFPRVSIKSKICDLIVKSVINILELNLQKQSTTLSENIEQLNQRITYTDDKINKLVYELYGLSEEEIAIVENIK